MAKEPKRAKSESLSLRLDPKARFILEFVARVEARSITTIVERAIKQYAERVRVDDPFDENGREVLRPNWTDFWDPSDGVRTLKMFAVADVPSTFEEDELRAFVKSHWQFFYQDKSEQLPMRAYIDIVWPEIDEFLEIWRSEKATNYWSAGLAMQGKISAAGVKPPQWPPSQPQAKRAPPQERKVSDLDDDIPF